MKYSALLLGCLLAIVKGEAQVDPVGRNYVLELPASTGFRAVFAYVEHSESEYIRVLNSPNPVIESYDLKSGTLKYSIRPRVEELGSVVKLAGDRFWVYDNFSGAYLLIDKNGKTLERHNELEQSSPKGLIRYFGNWRGSPLVLYEDKIFTTVGFLYGNGVDAKSSEFLNQGIVRAFNTKTKELSWIGGMSPKSRKYNFGYSNRYACIRAKDNLIISASFSMEKAVYNMKTGAFFYPEVIDTTYRNLIQPVSTWENNVSISDDETLRRHFNSIPYFTYILYDEFKDLFYQFLYYQGGLGQKFETVVLVLDNTLEYRREFRFSDEYTYDGAFVTAEGLNLLNLHQYKQDDNYLVFDTFVLD